MNNIEYKNLAKFEETYWWHKGKLALIQSLLSKYLGGKRNLNIFELGCGTGLITQYLATKGSVSGIDISAKAVDFCKSRGLDGVILGDINKLDLSQLEEKFDLVLALDVLEHIQDDLEAIKRANVLLKDGGWFLVSVPAHKFLWSQHDEALHHKRRYTRYELVKKLELAGFTVVKCSYFIFLFFPIIYIFRILDNFFSRNVVAKTSYIKLPAFLNSFLAKILAFEAAFVTKSRFPLGVTLLVVAKKSGN